MRIAILAPTAAPALRDAPGEIVGGAERQIASLGSALLAAGHRVDILLAAEGDGRDWESRSGRVWPRLPLGGAPILKLVHPKGSALLAFLRDRRSEVLLQRGASEMTALAVAAGRLASIPTVFMIASDRDLETGREILPHPQDRALYRESVRRVDRVVAQTREQARRLWRLYGRKAAILPSFWRSLPGDPRQPQGGGRAILWGGNLRPVKRPEWLIDMARRFPQEQFLVYGGAAAGAERYAAEIVAEFEHLPNLDYLGPVSPAELPGIYSRAALLLCSSEAEGFPNTFLEAWAAGLPVLSTVDPDGLLAGLGLGIMARSRGELAAGLRCLLAENEAVRAERRGRTIEYLAKNHDDAVITAQWEELLAGLLLDRAEA